MGLSATLSIAQAALQANANQTTTVSQNIAGVNATGYSRKVASLTTQSDGTPSVSVARASNAELFGRMLGATSDASAAQSLSDGLDQLERTVGLTASASASESGTSTSGTSPADRLTKMTTALSSYAAAPDNAALGQAFLSSAQALATTLNGASQTVQGVRGQADSAITTAVADVNSLLGQFTAADAEVVKGTATGADISSALDKRDAILTSLSKSMGIITTTNTDGSMSISTDSGVTLFDRTPSPVSFQPTASFADGTVGAAVMVGGIPVTGASAVVPLKSGSIAGLTTLRDTTTVQYQNQLDQIASSLVTTFADSDQTGGTAPTIPGLFTYSGAPTMPSVGQTGIAASIKVNGTADPSQGGSLSRIRDGNVGAPSVTAYNGNTTGAAAYATHLTALAGKLNSTQSFNAASGGAGSATLAGYAASSVSWLEGARATASDTATTTGAVSTQAATSLSNSTGVNLDQQLSLMLDLEHSYSASAELMSTVNSMFGTLINNIR